MAKARDPKKDPLIIVHVGERFCRVSLYATHPLNRLPAGGHLIHRALLVETCEMDPLPPFRLVFAQLAASCKALGEAIACAGEPRVKPVTAKHFIPFPLKFDRNLQNVAG